MGNAATAQRIACNYYWPDMSGDITRYVRSCLACQQVAPKHLTPLVTLGEVPIMSLLFERVVVDIV